MTYLINGLIICFGFTDRYRHIIICDSTSGGHLVVISAYNRLSENAGVLRLYTRFTELGMEETRFSVYVF